MMGIVVHSLTLCAVNNRLIGNSFSPICAALRKESEWVFKICTYCACGKMDAVFYGFQSSVCEDLHIISIRKNNKKM